MSVSLQTVVQAMPCSYNSCVLVCVCVCLCGRELSAYGLWYTQVLMLFGGDICTTKGILI